MYLNGSLSLSLININSKKTCPLTKFVPSNNTSNKSKIESSYRHVHIFVQVSPVQENIVIDKRPWWERYQPISYKWVTRSGTRQQFIDMVARCNKAGVRIYVDVIMNHMSGDWNDAHGTGNSRANTYNFDYPQVPYTGANFHARCAVNNYNDPSNVRNCELVGLHDLDQSQKHVRLKLMDFLNDLVGVGVAGFRFVFVTIALHDD